MDQNISHAGQSGAQSRNVFILSFRQLVASHLPSGFMSEPNTHEQLEYAFKTLSEGAPLLANFEAEVQEHSILSFADELSGLLFSHLSDYFHNLNVDQSDLIVFPMPVSTMVNSVLKGNTDASALVGGAHTLSEEVRSLIGTMLMRPIRQAVRIAFEHDHPSHEWRLGYCPVCGLWAPMGRIEPEHGRRLLWCIGCNGQWRFPRVCCPLCYESDQKKLGYLSVEEWPAWRLYTCETCHRSLKTRDERHTECADSTEMDIDYVDSGILDDDTDALALADTQESKNMALFGNIFYNPVSKLRMGLEVYYIKTTYKSALTPTTVGETDADNVCINFSTKFSF